MSFRMRSTSSSKNFTDRESEERVHKIATSLEKPMALKSNSAKYKEDLVYDHDTRMWKIEKIYLEDEQFKEDEVDE